MFIDCEAFNRGDFGALANQIEERCRKGSQICIEGRLHLDQWDDKASGAKRTKHKIVVESLQLLDRREDGMGGESGGGSGRSSAPSRGSAPASGRSGSGFSDGAGDEPSSGEEIPF